METELTIEGKVYISTKQAAALTGYTHDYIGQLSRAGKIPGKRVGRAKYVDKEALLAYKADADAQKETSAQARSKKFKAGRKVPLARARQLHVQSSAPQAHKQESGNTYEDDIPTEHSRSSEEAQVENEITIPDFREEVSAHTEQAKTFDAVNTEVAETNTTEPHTSHTSSLEPAPPYAAASETNEVYEPVFRKRAAEDELGVPIAEEQEKPRASEGVRSGRALPSPFSRPQLVAAVLLFAIAGGAFAVSSAAPMIGGGMTELKENMRMHTSRVVSGMESTTNKLIGGASSQSTEVFTVVHTSDRYANDIFASGEADNIRSRSGNDNLIASIRTQATDAFANTPPFALASDIQSEITESTKYAQIELAYVGAVMEYRFLEIGADVKTLAKKALEVMQSVSAPVTSFATGQSASVGNAVGESTPGIFERAALFVFHTTQSLKETLTSLLSEDLDTFEAPNASYKE